jgi:NhaP-type Na+/H+ or K+/H+ antiporter
MPARRDRLERPARLVAHSQALRLDSTSPDRAPRVDLTLGVVVFSILIQRLTIKPLVGILRRVSGSWSTDQMKEKYLVASLFFRAQRFAAADSR